MMILAIIISVAAIIVAICAIIGLYKGYSGTKSWAAEYLLTAVITIAVYNYVDFENKILNLSLVIGTAILLLLLFGFISSLIRKAFKRKIADARLYDYYDTYGDREQNILEIRDAIERDDKKRYKKLTGRMMEETSGVAGAGDRFLGVINMLIKGAVVCAMAVIIVLLCLQFTQLSFVLEGGALYSIYASSIWQTVAPYALDLVIIALIQFVLSMGYRSGILYALFFIVVAALVVGAGYVAYNLAFKTEAFISLASGSGMQTIAQIVIMVVLFIVEFIVIMVLSVVCGNGISALRNTKAFSVIDGIIGAFVFTVIALAVFMFIGAMLYSFHDFGFMQTLNSYCSGGTYSSVLFKCLYTENPLNDFEYIVGIQSTLAGFFGG